MADNFPQYPATSFDQAVDLTIYASNQLGDVINGDATSVVSTESGDIPTLRKALIDNFYFKTPIDWVEGESTTVFNQLYYFGGTLSTSGWYYAPQATPDNPIVMGSNPSDDANWRLYQTATTPAQVFPWSTEITQVTSSIVPPYEFDTAIVTYNGAVLVPGRDYTISNNTITFTPALVPEPDAEVPDILFCYIGKVQEGNPNTNYVTYNSLAAPTAADIIGTSSGKTIQEVFDAGASVISLTQGGTVQNAIMWLTPEMFGAKGDGVTDDTAAMQAAINACKYKTLIISNGKKYRTKNLTVPHPMTFRGLGRRQNGAIVPYGNVDAESFVHSGTLIWITSSSTVTFYDLTINALDVALSTVDGYRLTGVGAADNSTGEYRPGFQMYNCNVSGFSGNNIYGGANRSFGILKDCQSESSGRTCITIDGVDWRIDHCYFGRSAEAHGISLTHESNAITNCDIYFNKRSGIFYAQSPGMTYIKIIGNTINSNGEHGITVGSPYDQPAGTIITGNIFWNNSRESTGTYHNIDLSYGRGHVVSGNVHKQYSVASPTNAPRCGYCVNLRNGATLSGPLTDSIDPLYSYVNGAINVKTESLFNQNDFTVGSGVEFTKKVGSSTGIGYRVRVTDENTDRTQVSPGKILLGDGFTAPTHGIQHLAAYPNVTMGVKGLGVIGTYDSSVLRVGTFRIWSDGSGNLRMKASADPTSATDGGIVSTRVDVPATATASGTAGQWAFDASYLYICVATNTWKRVGLATW